MYPMLLLFATRTTMVVQQHWRCVWVVGLCDTSVALALGYMELIPVKHYNVASHHFSTCSPWYDHLLR